jgi:hypothetical protein
MKSAFKVLAYLIALGVVVQAASMVFAVAGLGIWVDDGGTFDKASAEAMFEGDVTFTGVAGFMIHGMNGMMVIPALALITFIVSFFAKVPGGIRNAAAVLALVVLQVTLGLFGHENAYFGMLHGINALILFTAALYTGRSASKAAAAEMGYQQETAATV